MKTNPKILAILLVFTVACNLDGQSIRGTVVDSETNSPFFGANVFLANTTKGAATNQNGTYFISNIAPGNYELIVSMMGYSVETRQVQIRSADTLEIHFQLKIHILSAPEIQVQASDAKEWRKNLEKFKRVFLGETRNASKCELLNPEILDFELKMDTLRLSDNPAEPLKVINHGLGLAADVILLEFFAADKNGFRCVFKPKFTCLTPTNEKQATAWQRARLKAYRGSLRHFLATLVTSQTTEDGFRIMFSDKPVMKRNFFMRFQPIDYFEPIIFDGLDEFSKILRFWRFLAVDYCGEISTIALQKIQIEFNKAGYVYDPGEMIILGRWQEMRFAEALPFDYKPPEE